MKWGKGWQVGLNREIERQQRVQLLAEELRSQGVPHDPQRAAYLEKRCTCGSGLANGLCVNCWPQ